MSDIADIRAASRRLVRELGFMRPTLAGTDLSPSAVHALVEIGARGSLTAAELCEVLLLEKSSVSRLLAKLSAAGEIVARPSETDARARPVSMTPKGRATLARIDRFAERQVSAALVRMEPASRRALAGALGAYAAALAQGRMEDGDG
ncbi:MarR family winged helix-turn-helix transcriptional regulator [Roseococcus sp. YIM B11640]|uniref:MarR family winged helix-turn-helix transcriptional regulator n=1 Tax=Roseococcus sp. YIM B11640 TaxID=3133973 RepID=UPI003C79A4D4